MNEQWSSLFFPNKTARFIKIAFIKTNDGSGFSDWLFIDEIQICREFMLPGNGDYRYEIEKNGESLGEIKNLSYVSDVGEGELDSTYRIRTISSRGASEWSGKILFFSERINENEVLKEIGEESMDKPLIKGALEVEQEAPKTGDEDRDFLDSFLLS